MPRASTSTTGQVLRRNQACRTCRKKKLKCDAARPHCGACVKAHKGLTAVAAPPGYAHPTEPQCSYDPIEGLTLAESVNPTEKIRQLEDEIAQLKNKLLENGIVDSPGSSSGASMGSRQATAASQRNGSIAPPQYSVHLSPPLSNNRTEIALPRAGLDVASTLGSTSPASLPRSSTSSPDMIGATRTTDDLFQLLFSGWNADLPAPNEMRHLVEVFFECDPCGSRILHKGEFLTNLGRSPKDSRFPHPSLLHAICASASRWTMQEATVLPNGVRHCEFADFHAGKTRQYIDRTMASGADIFQVLQACIILSWFLYAEGRWVEVWIFCGFQTRVAVPLRLNHPKTYTNHGSASPGAYLAPPKDSLDLEMRRRTWWMAILFDRIVSVGGWLHSIEKERIVTELPLRYEEFERSIASIFPDNPQNLNTPDLYTTHPDQYTDSFLLLIKAVMLFGKVTDINTDFQLSHPSSPRRTDDPYARPGFRALDELVAEKFLSSLPEQYSKPICGSPINSQNIDTDLYLVHLIPHAATITLHNPYINFIDPGWKPNERCIQSADAILHAHMQFVPFSGSMMDSTYLVKLHPFVVICWYLAAVVKVQYCKHMIEIGNADGEIQVWGEINILRWAMYEFGAISPIGVRQEKLLKTLMEDIVRMTDQEKPLELRLYPFSRSSAFDGANGSAQPSTVIAAPLPVSDPMDVVSASQAASPSLMVNGADINGLYGLNGMDAAQTLTSMQQMNPQNGLNPQNGHWDTHYHHVQVTPSPPSYSSTSTTYVL